MYEYNYVQGKQKYSAGLLYAYDIMLKVYNSQQEVTPGPIEWLNLSFASCVIHEGGSYVIFLDSNIEHRTSGIIM